jgi:hypothetical protein
VEISLGSKVSEGGFSVEKDVEDSVRQSPAFVLSHVTILVTRAGKVIAIYLDRAAEAQFLQITMKEWSLT